MLSTTCAKECVSPTRGTESRSVPHISVCVCTYKRPVLLKHLLEKLNEQETGGCFTFSIVVVDNDHTESGRQVVDEFIAATFLEVRYCIEPRQNIALARNKAIANGTGDFIAFIDDDEFPTVEWLRTLFTVLTQYEVAGVLGPVRPYFRHEPPEWVRKGNFFDRPTYMTGYRIGAWEARTGNVLFARSILDGLACPFRPEFGTAGEDIDFFRRMMAKGDIFIWSHEAIVYEVVPPDRCTKRYLVRKALLRGSNFPKHPTDRATNYLKSVVAVPGYGIALPFIFFAGDHHFIKYLVKFCDHAGRLLALVRLNPMKERDP